MAKNRIRAVLDQIEADDIGKFDLACQFNTLRMLDKNTFVIKDFEDNDHKFTLSPTAFNQLFSKIGIPPGYAEKTPTELLIPHYRYFHGLASAKRDSEVLIRGKKLNGGGNRMRALLSDRYSILDNRPVAESIVSVLPNNVDIESIHLTEDRFDTRFIFKDYKLDAGTSPDGSPNVFYIGVHVTNGETGNSGTRLELLIYEEWCSNGAVRRFNSKPLFSKRHIGEMTLENDFREAVRLVEREADINLGLMRAAVKDKVQTPYEVLGNLFDRHKNVFRKMDRDNVIEAYNFRPISNRYGMVSAITQAAHKRNNYEDRLSMELVAGDLLTKKISL